MRRYDYVPYGGSCEVKDDKGVRVERAEYFVLASDFDEYKRGAEALLRQAREALDSACDDLARISMTHGHLGASPKTEELGKVAFVALDSWLGKE